MNLKQKNFDKIITKEFLYREYVIKEKSLCKILKELNKSMKCSNSVLKTRFQKYNIPRRKNRSQNNPNYKDGRSINKSFCECGKEKSYKSKYCMICSHIGKRNPNYKHGLTYEKICKAKDCQKKVSYYNEYCRDCYKRFHVGEKCYQWEGGKSFEPYTIDFSNRLKEAIRDRDNRICQLCGIKEEKLKRKLDVHHIDYDKKNCDESNLISLCRSCHGKTQKNKKYWTKHFKNKTTGAKDGKKSTT